MNLGIQNKLSTPVPPEKGAFPLDHFGECQPDLDEYNKCLKAHKNASRFCRDLSKKYLECRMSKGLMVKEDPENLGFGVNVPTNVATKTQRKEATGFIAGTERVQGK